MNSDPFVVGIGYTLATGRLFTSMGKFHAYAEELLGRPVLTHEFAEEAIWEQLRQRFETLMETTAEARLV